MAQTSGISGARILVLSRCAQTLHRFRSALLLTLMERGARVTALGASGEGFEHKLRAAGIDFRHIPVSLRGVAPIADCWLFLRLLLLFRRERPAVIHAFTIKPAIFATLAAAVAGVPTRIVTITGLGHAFTTAPAPLRAAVEFLYRVALRRATLVFFQNGDDRRLFIERRLVHPAQVRLVAGSGVDLARFLAEPLPSERGATPRFLMIGRLLVEKGVREFLDAARRVRATHPQVVFTLIGGSDSRNPSNLPATQIEELRASPDVQWIGEVEDVRPHVAASDVVVLPSYREGLPRALLEGAAMGRALIATDAPGCREMVRDGVNGDLVPDADGQALADAMLRYLADPAAIRVHGAQSRKIAEQEFDEGVVISRFIDSYEEGLRVVSA